ncbi:MAG: SDR family oxidoreductase [Bacteroidales bacterium]|nr:SDR family oxidoreductase [Bacteroidales bacterium]MBN2758429.1 SDR family oxidoreductase [Bacteroidales bacterium]
MNANIKLFKSIELFEKTILKKPVDILYHRIVEKDINGNNGKLKDKVVIITGASSGIGRALAIEFAEKGAKVVLAARNYAELVKLKNQIRENGGKSIFFITDVTKKDDCKKLINSTLDIFGKIDILINNAGISMRANFADLELFVIQNVMDTNFYGTVFCTKYALPHILKQKGSIIGISSISGLTPLPGRTAYVASKFAMDGFLETIRIENFKRGLHVMLVHPGFTASNIRNVALNEKGESQKETPRNEAKMMTAEKLAKIISKATVNRKRNIIVGIQGKIAVWMHKNFPAVTDKLIYYEMSKEPNSPF